MTDSRVSPGIWDAIWEFFASIRLTIILLLSLAVTSIIGTLIPQNKPPMEYLQAFGEFRYRLFNALDFFDMYRSWWFRLLIVLLALNIIICSIERFAALSKILFVKNPKIKPARFRRAKNKVVFESPRPASELKERYTPIVRRGFSYFAADAHDNGLWLYAEKWRWTRIGVYVVHLSVVLLLIGSLVGSILGFEGFVNIPEKESTSRIFLRNTGQAFQLPFEVRCEDFDVSFYDNGAPKEFRSSLKIIENGQTVIAKDIIVNDPLRYRGINFFQSSYGKMDAPHDHSDDAAPEEIDLRVIDKASGAAHTFSARIGERQLIPDGGGEFTVRAYQPQLTFGGQDIGPGLQVEVKRQGQEPQTILLPLHFPSFDKMRGGALFFSVTGQKKKDFSPQPAAERYYTGLQVTRDPGVPVVYAGFIIMLVGFVIAFFMSHQMVAVEITAQGQGSRVTVSGVSNRNKLGMDRKVQRLAAQLQKK
ncbi:MAG: cytochrome c biogenesis protein ResB [Desulfobacterales bacterium]|jgi:cytochrome c biogenesis protein